MSENIPDLKAQVESANGMLPFAVYEEIYRTAQCSNAQSIVEVGTAHGAATIALALGAASRGPGYSVWTVDRLGGRFSSRCRYGTAKQNETIVMENLRRAGVGERVRLFVGSSDDFVAAGQCPEKIDLVMLDADGRIDRDLMHFYRKMPVGAPLIIDDVDSEIYLSRSFEGAPYVDLKHRITNLLISAFADAGFVRIEKRIENTAFLRRGDRDYDERVFLEISLPCYRELVFADASHSSWNELMYWHENRSTVRDALSVREAIPPRLLAGLRRLRQMARRLSFPKPS